MSKQHIKRLTVPKTWVLLRKEHKFVTRPNPGPHSFKFSVPVSLVLKELGYASSTKEARKILNSKSILVDGRRIKDVKFPVGLMDTVNIKDVAGFFRMVLDVKGRLKILPIKESETSVKLSRVNNKKIVSKNRIQLNLFDGKNILTDKKDIKTSDSLMLKLPSLGIEDVLKFEKNAFVLLIGGRHMGVFGSIEGIDDKKIKIKSDTKTFLAEKRFCFVVGKDKEVVQLK
ncbi:30S ribosomal protein S4e [Candidatus Woesearchaeota archaeon]|nr:30S ribosomal protein S4e [Candidatus Woesearchaeota archaeon]